MKLHVVVVMFALGWAAQAVAQQPPAPAPRAPREAAAIDLTGTWVSIVNEDWRWRMVTPPVGDFPGIPLNPAGQTLAKTWDPSRDGSCLAFGAAALLRMPTRVRFTWETDRTLMLEADNGQQTRRLTFGQAPPSSTRTLQGQSSAEWVRTLPPSNPFGLGFPGGPPRPGGSLKVVTTNLSGGWLRRNGVPYSENAVVTEYFDRFPVPNGGEWFVVTTVVDDPTYLMRSFVTSSHFRREPDDSKWSPRPCRS